jgi:hypothetical protein
MKYAFYSDPAHGWLKVSIEELKQLDICSKITAFSYITADRKYAYLEEDQDAETFFAAALAADWFENFNAIRRCTQQFTTNSSSFIRNLDSFKDYQLSLQPVTPVIPAEPIFNF